MPGKGEDKLLEVLRTLRPPQPSGGTPAPASTSSPGPPPEDLPHGRDPAARRKIEFGLEELGLFLLAAVMLVVLAFLLGWYGRGIAGRATPGAGPPAGEIRTTPMPEPAAALNLGARSKPVRALSAAGTSYSILAARLPLGSEAEAEDYRRLLEERGFAPAWLRRTGRGIELCVGRFSSPADALALEWLPKVKALHGAFAGSQMVRLPQE